MAIIINGRGRVGVRTSSGGGGSTPSYLLDIYNGAAVAYSAARRLSSTYSGPLIRVRRSSDNAEANIGFDGSGNLDEAALTSFVGANNGFVTTWYDQSGNGKNMENSTASNQPRIVTSGTVLKDNSKPALSFNGTSQYLAVTDNTILHASSLTSCFYTAQIISGNSNPPLASKSYNGDGGYFFGQLGTDNKMQLYIDQGLNIVGTAAMLNSQKLFTNFNQTGTNNIKYYINGSLDATSTKASLSGTNSTYFALGFDPGGFYLKGNFQETIIYSTDKTSDKTGIEGNINTFYSIY
jgi:hypothetical protein